MRKLKQTIILLLTLLILTQFNYAQKKISVIRSNSNLVDIKDGNLFKKGDWRITPAQKPDVYITNNKNKRVTFYTDLDSISFVIKPNKKYNFVILLNNKDSALTQIIYRPSKLEILKNASKYNFNDKREIIKYTYKSITDTDLIRLKNTFGLESAAGTGNEISKILALLHWVHNNFPHDGTKDAPKYNSISELMTICLNEHKTVDCGSLARIMEQCYLAMGFKARRVVCLPKDSTDFDCHSINIVYSNTLNKWLWIDPTNDAYVMNEKGELLSIAEVRERLINDKPLILNPDANWNHKTSVEKAGYLYNYMAKNLYAFACYVPGGGESKCNLLLPVEYKGIIPRIAMYKPKCTNNPNAFWVKPE